jgi:hypothetical protein
MFNGAMGIAKDTPVEDIDLGADEEDEEEKKSEEKTESASTEEDNTKAKDDL